MLSESTPLVNPTTKETLADSSNTTSRSSSSLLWKDRLVTGILVACAVVALMTIIGPHTRSPSPVLVNPTTTTSSSIGSMTTATAEPPTIPIYRPICKLFTNKHQVSIIQTSMATPSQQYTKVECLFQQQPTFAHKPKMGDVNTYGAPDAILQLDLSSPAFPNRNVTIMGFGGAFTEASALNYDSLSQEGKDAVMELLYGKQGLGYA